MKRELALVLAALVSFAPAAAPAAEATFTDPTCPNAVAPVIEYTAKAKDPGTTLDAAITGAQRVVDAYDQCAKEKLSRGEIQNLHYAQLSSAQWNYVVGGWQHLAGNDDLARTAYQTTVKLTQNIIDWKPMQQNYYGSNDINIGSGNARNSYSNGVSQWHDTAVKVRDAAQRRLDNLPKPPAPAPAAATPAPAHT